MRLRLHQLVIQTRRTTERVQFSDSVTFLHGPVSTGKSTVARLVDYCLGGDLERTPALRHEFLSVELSLSLGTHACTIERAADDTQNVRVTWTGTDGVGWSVNAPLAASAERLVDADVHNLSDLIFYLCALTPIKVRQRSRDPESPLIRLSVRDLWFYCYLDQTHLDSSFFRLEDPFRGRKSQDAMRFFTGLHSERLSQLETELIRASDEQRGKREAVQQIRAFMTRFELGSEMDIANERMVAESALAEMKRQRADLESTRASQTHPTDALRQRLRRLSGDVERIRQAMADEAIAIAEQNALRAELITAKTKAARVDQAGRILEGAHFHRCPECGTDISGRETKLDRCALCESPLGTDEHSSSQELEALRRDLNERIDQLADSVERRQRELGRMARQREAVERQKAGFDRQLQDELSRYDSAYVESIRGVDREIATLEERMRSLVRLQEMPRAIDALEEEAGAIQGRIDRLRTSVGDERHRLRTADENIAAIAAEFKRVMLSVSFPGVSEDDTVVIDPRDWSPSVIHGDQQWSFWDTGSGGKKTLFNVCYALALHAVALERNLPVPTCLIIDSPTKNISEDENPELVQSLYEEIYNLARQQAGNGLQVLLIDSDLVAPRPTLPGFLERRIAGEPNAPSLIPYYSGP